MVGKRGTAVAEFAELPDAVSSQVLVLDAWNINAAEKNTLQPERPTTLKKPAVMTRGSRI